MLHTASISTKEYLHKKNNNRWVFFLQRLSPIEYVTHTPVVLTYLILCKYSQMILYLFSLYYSIKNFDVLVINLTTELTGRHTHHPEKEGDRSTGRLCQLAAYFHWSTGRLLKSTGRLFIVN